MSTFANEPVIASKPVANTMASNSYSLPPVIRPFGVISSIGAFADVDQRDVVAVEGLEIIDVEADALGADRIGGRLQQLCDLRILHDLADLLAHILGRGVVRRLVERKVVVGGHEVQAALLPFGRRRPCWRSSGVSSSAPLVGSAADNAVARFLARLPAQLRIVVFPGLLVLRRQVVVARRKRVVRRALEHGQVLRLRRDHRDRLDRRRAGADDADAQAGEVHALMRPLAGVVGLALEARQPLEVRRARVGERAGRHDHMLRRVAACRRRSSPSSGRCPR